MTIPLILSKNIYFVNVAKTLAIFLVVLAHLSIPYGFHSFINAFHMPLFFVITGYLINTEKTSFKFFFIKKLKTLLIPYYVFVVLSFVFWYFLGRKYGNDALSEYDLAKYISGSFLAIPSKEYLGFNFPLWFLPSLFCAEIMLYWIKRILKNYFSIVIICLFGLGILLKEMNLFRLPLGIDVALFALLFIQTGQWLKNKNRMDRYICNPPLWMKMLLSIVFLFVTIYISQVNGEPNIVSMAKRIFNNYVLYLIGAVSGSLFILYLSNCLLFKSPIFNFYGRNTIVILCLHLIILSLIKGIQVFILHIPLSATESNLGINILYVIFTFILLIPVIYFINKYTPFIIGRKKGII
jgi:fucose 4-O-acetylase-like acetyltransferase